MSGPLSGLRSRVPDFGSLAPGFGKLLKGAGAFELLWITMGYYGGLLWITTYYSGRLLWITTDHYGESWLRGENLALSQQPLPPQKAFLRGPTPR